jgi:methyl-accepting chemotaxis protein
MNISNWKIGTRLGLGFALVVLLLITTTVFSINRIAVVNGATTTITEDRVPKVMMMQEIEGQMSIIARSVRNALLIKTSDEAKKEIERVQEARKSATGIFEKLGKAMNTPQGQEKLKATIEARVPYGAGLDKFIKLFEEGKKSEATDLLMGDIRKAQIEYFNKLEDLQKYVVDVMHKGSQEASEVYATARILMLVLASIAIIIAAVIAILATRSITRPLNEAVKIAETVASGDLRSQIEVKSTDETGQLMQALKHMNDSLLGIVGQVRTGTDMIATASAQIAAGNQDLSARTEEQASSLEETASSMEEMTSTVKQNGDNAHQANQLAITASNIAMKGGAVVAEVVQTMGAINESSKKMADIINVIDGIAFQTNILALNAAVEAARAGEQGRGFAVVATEVRNLAQRSAGAAREIKILIDDSVSKVGEGTKLVDQAGTTMTEIVSSNQRVTDIMSEITAATREQVDGIEQINQAVTQMDQVTQQNAALVEEAAAAAESMQEQAGKLVHVVSVFRTGQDTAIASAKQAPAKSPAATHAKVPTNAPHVTKPSVHQAGLPRAVKGIVSAPAANRGVPIAVGSNEEWEQF